jgi:hypothetical protein
MEITLTVLPTQQRCSRVFGQTSRAAFQNPTTIGDREPRRHVELEQQIASPALSRGRQAADGGDGQPGSNLPSSSQRLREVVVDIPSRQRIGSCVSIDFDRRK